MTSAAARGAGLTTLVTVSSFTAAEDFAGAALVVDHLGDPGEPLTVIDAPAGVRPSGLVTVGDLEDLLATYEQEGR